MPLPAAPVADARPRRTRTPPPRSMTGWARRSPPPSHRRNHWHRNVNRLHFCSGRRDCADQNRCNQGENVAHAVQMKTTDCTDVTPQIAIKHAVIQMSRPTFRSRIPIPSTPSSSAWSRKGSIDVVCPICLGLRLAVCRRSCLDVAHSASA